MKLQYADFVGVLYHCLNYYFLLNFHVLVKLQYDYFMSLAMAEEALARAGLHIDDLNKIRLLEPEVTQHTTEIRDQCKDFLDSMFDFS